MLSIAVCKDIFDPGWHEKFLEALENWRKQGFDFRYDLVEIDKADWVTRLEPYDAVIWKPFGMGVKIASHIKEKVYFIEQYLKKRVYPNYSSIWHFESKFAQSYLLDRYKVKTPLTFTTFDYEDCLKIGDSVGFPCVFKKSYGASSSNVRLLKDASEYKNVADNVFFRTLWTKIKRKYLKLERKDGFYVQRFIPDNTRDLRITVIGHNYAYAFYRLNRENDFRASGSGRIDSVSEVPSEAIRYCMILNKQMNFDSMAYDIVFTEDDFIVLEISYAYLDHVPYQQNGHHVLGPDGELRFVEGHTWPQELWVRWLLEDHGFALP